ncbi:TonB-dependent receptor plug domain-containing protein [Thiorhodococcus mannitoliphagus]|uniref:TonB-dependent receptor plug domain-containing protein n=1 Tax=Thiorhodococcus mannitoliphagus TaxID=329406 RepID=A0A6P1DLM8_9GAMM|nr:TonB-dependent receptor plug domain-containing protein [Thiorhodococcus mannitoliphagus]NEX18948.1 TonB-dependent receptor plug domain-containing protein [Thiorhodococcus mannitoliphagus]
MQPRLKPLTALIALYATQSLAADDVSILSEVLVTAPGELPLDSGATTLNRAEIAPKRARTSDTASLLTDIPGVSAQTGGGLSSLPVIRGLADDRLRTKVDGMDLVASCPNHMNSPLSYIDPTAVESIQVYSGVTPVSLGGDSIGGSILVQSAAPAFADPGERLVKGETGIFYRSNGDSWGGNLSGTYATDSLSLTYTGSYAQSDNYKAGGDFKDYGFTGRPGHILDLDEVGSTAYEASNQSVKFGWQNDGNLVDLTYGRQHIPYENYPNQRMDMTDNLSDQFNLAYTGELAWGTLKARAYYEHTQHEMDFGDDKRYWYGGASGGSAALEGNPCSPISGGMTGCAAGMPMYTDGKNGGVTLSAELPLASGDLVRLGGEYQNYRLDDWWTPSGANMWPYTFWNINDGQRDRFALYGEWEISKDRWTHILGVRFENIAMDAGQVHGYNLDSYPTTGTTSPVSQTRDASIFNTQDRAKTDHNWDLSWLARFTPADTQTYEIGLAQKTRSPNLYERYTWSTWQMAAFMNNFVGDGNGYVGNLDLKPEVASTLSLTADWHDAGQQRWGVKLTPYYTYVRDYIDAVQWDSATNAPRVVPVVDNFTVLKYVNQSAYLYGLDLAAHYVVASGTAYGDFRLQGLASYTKGENDDTDDTLYNIMPLNAKLILTQELGPWRNTLEGEFVAGKEDVSQVRNEMQTAGYGLAHLRSRYERKTWSLEVGIENLFDRFYELPLGGAYVGQGTTMTIPPEPNEPQWGTPVPGPGRSIYASLSLSF